MPPNRRLAPGVLGCALRRKGCAHRAVGAAPPAGSARERCAHVRALGPLGPKAQMGRAPRRHLHHIVFAGTSAAQKAKKSVCVQAQRLRRPPRCGGAVGVGPPPCRRRGGGGRRRAPGHPGAVAEAVRAACGRRRRRRSAATWRASRGSAPMSAPSCAIHLRPQIGPHRSKTPNGAIIDPRSVEDPTPVGP